MVTLVCWNCNQEIEVRFLDDIVDCPNCGEKISREVSKVLKWTHKRKMKKKNEK